MFLDAALLWTGTCPSKHLTGLWTGALCRRSRTQYHGLLTTLKEESPTESYLRMLNAAARTSRIMLERLIDHNLIASQTNGKRCALRSPSCIVSIVYSSSWSRLKSFLRWYCQFQLQSHPIIAFAWIQRTVLYSQTAGPQMAGEGGQGRAAKQSCII